MIEPLESRIAPASTYVSPTTATFTDVDGDKVTVVFSKPILTEANVASVVFTSAMGIGEIFRTLDLTGTLPVSPDGINITIAAVPQDLTPMDTVKIKSGDGLVNLGYLNSTGHPLGMVKLPGDLGAVDAGNTALNAVALQGLALQSMGEFGLSTGAPDLQSNLAGSVKAITVKGNVRDALVDITGSSTMMVDSSLGSLTIGGSLLTTLSFGRGAINVVGKIGPVKIGGSVLGGTLPGSGQIVSSAGSIGTVTIGGDLIGGPVGKTGYIYAKTTMGAVSVGGDVRGGGASGTANAYSGFIGTGNGLLTSVKIGGSVIGGAGANSGGIIASNDLNSTGQLGPVTIGGSLIGGSGSDNTGIVGARGNVTSVKVAGDVIGGLGENAGAIETTLTLGPVTIGGDVRGTGGAYSGYIVGTDILGVTVKGSLIGGTGSDAGGISAVHKLSFVKIGGSVLGGIGAAGNGLISAGQNLGAVTIGGSLVGGMGSSSGTIELGDDADARQIAGPITIGGSVIGGGGPHSGSIRAIDPDQFDFFGAIKVAGDVRGGTGINSGSIELGNVTTITIGGSVLGGNSTKTGYVSAFAATSLSIGHDLRGSDAASSDLNDCGYLKFTKLGSLTISGSIFAGRETGAGTLARSGGLYAEQGFGSVTVRGSIIGQPSNLATLYAGGLPGDPVANNFAFRSLTIGGSVDNAWIFGAVNESGAAIFGNVQIGAVKVTGDWIASSLGTSATSTNGVIGDGNDANFGLGTAGKIASIVIGGQVLGRGQTGETFGFFAHQIGSFKYNGIALALRPGAANDAFFPGGPNNAFAVGASFSSTTVLKPDPFAVHVYEV